MARLSPSGHRDPFTRDALPPQGQWPRLVFELPKLRYPGQLNCAQALLDDTMAEYGAERTALIGQADENQPGESRAGDLWSYGRLSRQVNQIARALTEGYGLVPGNRVLLRGPNSPWLAACWLAVLKAGCVAVTTMPLLRAAELREIADRAQVQLALAEQGLAGELAEAGFPDARVLTFSARAADGGELGRAAAARPAHFAAAQTAPDDVALIAFTSGTSGEPKATLHFHRDVLAIADTFSEHVVRPRPDDVFIGSPSLAFTFGLGGLLVFPLRAGAAAVLLERTAPDVLFRAIAEYQATVLFTAPTAYRAALERIADYDLSSLRRCVSAGETLPAWVWRAFYEATGQRIIDGIGSTEMLHIFISAADDGIRVGATGKPVPGFRARVVDESGREVPDGTPGLLAVQGPTGCRYLRDERQRAYVRDGWNITGDIYLRDRDGYFWYQARNDDMIVTAGYKVAAPEVEQALLRHPMVRDCGVVGVPDASRGALVKAYVVLAPGHYPSDELAAELQEFAKSVIAPYKYPRLVEFVAALPMSSTGKLQRGALRSSVPVKNA
jgi:2-aminobenzoate-CoA ligase